MARLKGQNWPSRTGQVRIYAVDGWQEADRPVAVFLPGAHRTAHCHGDWYDILKDDAEVVLLDLPGHGGSDPIRPATVKAMAEAVHDVLSAACAGRKVLLVGESLGGTIGLYLGAQESPGPVRAVFAAEPPLTTTKLWPLSASWERSFADPEQFAFNCDLARDTFGLQPDGRINERIYYPLIGAARLPTMIVAGDEPLMPIRELTFCPSLMDAVDRFAIERLDPGTVTFRQLTGCGHLVLDQARAQCGPLIRQMIAEHLK